MYGSSAYIDLTVIKFVPGSIACAAYPLGQIDTIDIETGHISKNSALNLVVFGVITRSTHFYVLPIIFKKTHTTNFKEAYNT